MPEKARLTPRTPTSSPRLLACVRDLSVIDTGTDLVRDLAVLTGHRADLIADRVRMINRLRDLMTSVFPSLERAFDYSSHKGALVLLTGYATPDRNPPHRTDSADCLVAEPQGARLGRRGRPRHRRGQGANGRAARARPDGQHHHRAGHRHPGPRRPTQGPRCSDRGDLRRTSAGSDHSVDARLRSVPRRFTAGRSQRLTCIPQRRAPRRRSRTRARPKRLRPAHRQPAPPRRATAGRYDMCSTFRRRPA